jgi:hypothetical protein
MAIPSITQIAKRGLVVILAVACFAIGQSAYTSDTRFSPVYALVSEIRNGRFLDTDTGRIEAFFSAYETHAHLCHSQERQAASFLKLYYGDLQASRSSLSALEQRATWQVAQTLILDALSCNPTDGDLWLRMAILERLLDPKSEKIDHFLTLSEITEPNEPIIARLRTQFFPTR